MAMLIHLLGGDNSSEKENPDCYVLDEGENFIGRLPDSQICIQDDSISRLHAKLYRKDDAWRIEDLQSCNGVLVNGEIASDTKLAEGDIITAGEVYFTLSSCNPDQLYEIRPWIEERAHDALSYHQDVTRSKGLTQTSSEPSFQTGSGEPIEENPSVPEGETKSTPKPPDISALKAPVIKPGAPMLKPPPVKSSSIPAKPAVPSAPSAVKPAAPVVKPAAPVVKPAAPVVNPAAPVVNPAAPIVNPAAPNKEAATPQNLNVMGSDPTMMIIWIVAGVLVVVVGLIWGLTDWFR